MTDTGDTRKVRVAVLFGGQSDEHDVSIRSAQTVMGALNGDRYEVVPIGITRNGSWVVDGDPMAALMAESDALSAGQTSSSNDVIPVAPVTGALAFAGDGAAPIDVVFPVLHGPFGEDGSVQGLLEVVGVPFVGSGVLGSAVAMDKAIAKQVLASVSVPQLPWQLVQRREIQDHAEAVADRLEAEIGLPCFTKPANLGSSVGISRVSTRDELIPALRVAAFYDRRIVVERGVDAREIELSVLGNDDPIASVAGEIVPRGGFYDYNAKYINDSTELVIPAELEPGLLMQLQQMAVAAFRALDLAGLARVDFFVERGTDQVYLNEVNTLPGFTSISMYPMLWQASGIPLNDLVDRLIDLAIERHVERKR